MLYKESICMQINIRTMLKITDFLIHILQGLVPLKWMAIESIRDSIYTEKTDM